MRSREQTAVLDQDWCTNGSPEYGNYSYRLILGQSARLRVTSCLSMTISHGT